MFDPIFLSAAVEITSICRNKEWVGLPNWQNIREDDPRIEKHPMIHKTWYVHPNQQMLQARLEAALPFADLPAATADAIPLLADNASVFSRAVYKYQQRAFGPKSQIHAKENVNEGGALPADVSRGRTNHRGVKKRGISESESRTPLAGDMGNGSHKRICADARSNTVNKMGEGVSKGVIYMQHPEAKPKTPAGSSLKAAGSSINPLAGRSGAAGAASPCPRCAREGKACMRAKGKTGLLLVCVACKQLKKKCELDINQPTGQRRRSGVRGGSHSRSPERAKARSMITRRMSTSVVQRRPLRVVMSYVSVPRLPISAPECTAVKLKSVERKMDSMEGVIDLLHREMETLRMIIDASS
ncbi:hypothetical protein EDB19DRAFT_254142 [Suillus lakei]|nr:hypothetical protein EDB19DRAFT_254142 [Suillus lakei]